MCVLVCVCACVCVCICIYKVIMPSVKVLKQSHFRRRRKDRQTDGQMDRQTDRHSQAGINGQL